MRYTDVKAYKEQIDKITARCNEYYQKVDELSDSVKDDDKFAEEIDKLDEEYSDVAKGWAKFGNECVVNEEFFNYFFCSLEKRVFCRCLMNIYGTQLDENTTFDCVIYEGGYYYYLVTKDGKEDYHPIGDEEIETKLENILTKKERYIVTYNDGWDNEWHYLESFSTEEKAKEFIAEKEQWKSDFKEEFGVDYDTLGDSDFTWDMEDWIAEFVNTNENKEEIRYKIEKI